MPVGADISGFVNGAVLANVPVFPFLHLSNADPLSS